ncbi:MAG: septation regulator SpoVG [Oscillospiraceae bacterium]
MTITDIKIRKIINEGRMKAVISITIDDMLAIHDIKVIQGPNRLFVAMPSRRDDNGIFRDIVHPIKPEVREEIEETLLQAYEEQISILEAHEEELAEQTEE